MTVSSKITPRLDADFTGPTSTSATRKVDKDGHKQSLEWIINNSVLLRLSFGSLRTIQWQKRENNGVKFSSLQLLQILMFNGWFEIAVTILPRRPRSVIVSISKNGTRRFIWRLAKRIIPVLDDRRASRVCNVYTRIWIFYLLFIFNELFLDHRTTLLNRVRSEIVGLAFSVTKFIFGILTWFSV